MDHLLSKEKGLEFHDLLFPSVSNHRVKQANFLLLYLRQISSLLFSPNLGDFSYTIVLKFQIKRRVDFHNSSLIFKLTANQRGKVEQC